MEYFLLENLARGEEVFLKHVWNNVLHVLNKSYIVMDALVSHTANMCNIEYNHPTIDTYYSGPRAVCIYKDSLSGWSIVPTG